LPVTATHVLRRLRVQSDPSRATFLLRFFRTGAGEYGEGDRFLGLTVPQVRVVASEFRDLPLADVETLLASPWHEARTLAVILLANRYSRVDAREQARIYALYLRRTD